MFEVETYLYGRCHLFALVVAKQLGFEMEFLWDTDFWHEGDDYPSTVLVHAYNALPTGQVFDARGIVLKEQMLLDYDCEQASFERMTVSDLNHSIHENVFEGFEVGEYEMIKNYIFQQFDVSAFKNTG